MNSAPQQPPDPWARITQLEKESRTQRRRIEQLQRQTEQAEIIALRSKQAILGTTRELQATVEHLERTTRELTEAKSRAEQANEAKSRFVATISHELRTPMNGILGTAELLMQLELPADQSELVEVIHRSSKGLLAIINDVLDFSKAESNRIELESVRFDLAKTVGAIVDLESNAAHRKNLSLRFEVAPQVPSFVLGDPVRLRQVLLNLLDNAIKFTATGEVELSILSCPQDSAQLEFRVRDSGIGIPADKFAGIFDPFVQADSSTTRRFGGSGLGLAICRHLVRLMGGDIEVASEVGVGSTFSFRIRMPAAPEGVAFVEHVEASTKSAHELGLRVLVVDDNPVNRLIAMRMVQRLGCACEAVEDGESAVKAAASSQFDVILMDCSMPGMDGYQATAAIRGLAGAGRSTYIVAMTAHALTGDREVCLAAGMNDYLTKPLEMKRLKSTLAIARDALSPALPTRAREIESQPTRAPETR